MSDIMWYPYFSVWLISHSMIISGSIVVDINGIISFFLCCCCSVAKWCLIIWPHELQHTRLPCPSLSFRVCSSSCPLSHWCYLTVSSSASPFSFCLQSFPASGSFHIRWPKYWSFRFSISPSNVDFLFKSLFRTDWLDLLVVQGTLKSLLQPHNSKASILQCSAFLMVQLSHTYMTTGKIIDLSVWAFVS